ncbi:MAG: T9SS type A sorting domain-containing protein [Bacteroidota bacterium]
MKSMSLFLGTLLLATASFAQPQQPQVLYSDTSHLIPIAGLMVDRGDEYQLLTRRAVNGVTRYRLDTSFQVLEERILYLSSTIEDLIPFPDGRVMVTGYLYNVDNTSKVSAIKVAPDGSPEWQAFGGYEGFGIGFGHSTMVENGNLLLIGRHLKQGYYDLTLSKIDSQGTAVWNRSYSPIGSCFGMNVLQGHNGNYLAIGTVAASDTVSPAGWLLETNQNGDSLRSVRFGEHDDRTTNIFASGDGYLITGQANFYQAWRPASLKLWRFDANLNLEWEKSFRYTDSLGIEHDIRVTKAAKTKDQGCIVLGKTFETIHDSLTEQQLYLGKFSSEGLLEWEMTLGVRDEANHFPKDVLPLEGGGYLVTAHIEDFTPLPGQIYTYYARLSDDGTPVIKVSRELELPELAVAIHPNPFDAELRGSIQLERPEAVEVSIYDLQGRQLNAQQVQGQIGRNAFVISTDHLPPASYLLRVSSSEGQWSQVVVKR